MTSSNSSTQGRELKGKGGGKIVQSEGINDSKETAPSRSNRTGVLMNSQWLREHAQIQARQVPTPNQEVICNLYLLAKGGGDQFSPTKCHWISRAGQMSRSSWPMQSEPCFVCFFKFEDILFCFWIWQLLLVYENFLAFFFSFVLFVFEREWPRAI